MNTKDIEIEEKKEDIVMVPKDPITEIVEVFMKDPAFRKQSEDCIKEIIKDGKISEADIPDMVILMVQVYNRRADLHIEADELPDVFYLLITNLLEETEYYKNMEKEKRVILNGMIRKLLVIVTMSAKTIIQTSKCSCFPCWK